MKEPAMELLVSAHHFSVHCNLSKKAKHIAEAELSRKTVTKDVVKAHILEKLSLVEPNTIDPEQDIENMKARIIALED